jgi:hypothetical protein
VVEGAQIGLERGLMSTDVEVLEGKLVTELPALSRAVPAPVWANPALVLPHLSLPAGESPA